MKLWCLKYVCRQKATIGVKGLTTVLYYFMQHLIFYIFLQITQRTVDINTEVEENSTAGNFRSVVLLDRWFISLQYHQACLLSPSALGGTWNRWEKKAELTGWLCITNRYKIIRWVSEWVSEWVGEWVGEWVSGWVSGQASEWVNVYIVLQLQAGGGGSLKVKRKHKHRKHHRERTEELLRSVMVMV